MNENKQETQKDPAELLLQVKDAASQLLFLLNKLAPLCRNILKDVRSRLPASHYLPPPGDWQLVLDEYSSLYEKAWNEQYYCTTRDKWAAAKWLARGAAKLPERIIRLRAVLQYQWNRGQYTPSQTLTAYGLFTNWARFSAEQMAATQRKEHDYAKAEQKYSGAASTNGGGVGGVEKKGKDQTASQ